MHFVKSSSLKGMPAFGLITITDIYRLHCLFFLDELNCATSWMQSWDSSIQEEENISIRRVDIKVVYKALALWLFGPNLVRPVVPVTFCEVGIYIRIRDFAYPKAFLICKGNNIFKILGNPHPTCLPGCGMPLGLGKAFLSPLILRLFWQQPIESLARKTAKITYALFNTLDNISLQ